MISPWFNRRAAPSYCAISAGGRTWRGGATRSRCTNATAQWRLKLIVAAELQSYAVKLALDDAILTRALGELECCIGEILGIEVHAERFGDLVLTAEVHRKALLRPGIERGAGAESKDILAGVISADRHAQTIHVV